MCIRVLVAYGKELSCFERCVIHCPCTYTWHGKGFEQGVGWSKVKEKKVLHIDIRPLQIEGGTYVQR